MLVSLRFNAPGNRSFFVGAGSAVRALPHLDPCVTNDPRVRMALARNLQATNLQVRLGRWTGYYFLLGGFRHQNH